MGAKTNIIERDDLNPDEELRRELLSDKLSDKHATSDHAYALAFAHWFGLHRQPARLLVTLYTATGEPVTISQLGAAHRLSAPAVHQYIMVLRQALDNEAIDCQRPHGYRLTDDGLAECRAALWQMGEVLRSAS